MSDQSEKSNWQAAHELSGENGDRAEKNGAWKAWQDQKDQQTTGLRGILCPLDLAGNRIEGVRSRH
jgi:hypothetical protein